MTTNPIQGYTFSTMDPEILERVRLGLRVVATEVAQELLGLAVAINSGDIPEDDQEATYELMVKLLAREPESLAALAAVLLLVNAKTVATAL